MSWAKWLDAVFPYIEPLTAEQKKTQNDLLEKDIEAIRSAKFMDDGGQALTQAQYVAAAEIERVRVSESKATTYLAVLAALVPLVITIQGATWDNKIGPAPEAFKLAILAVATLYVAAAGYHAFKTLQVSGFQRVGESEVTDAWQSSEPLPRLTRSTLLASRRSRNAVNAKITRIKVTHQHLLRAFGAFILLLLLDPIFYASGFQNKSVRTSTSVEAEESQAIRSTVVPDVSNREPSLDENSSTNKSSNRRPSCSERSMLPSLEELDAEPDSSDPNLDCDDDGHCANQLNQESNVQTDD
ncbi:hypothetical protein [Henriciella sp.]|uniref:hypothetical protein n=1 Tax=Henriciella sp. TaxID=1968823 RepID=UPI002637D06E|nr:hypothetical protein [Henriciella sp.]